MGFLEFASSRERAIVRRTGSFPVASKAADLAEDELLEFRISPDSSAIQLLLTENQLAALVEIDGPADALPTGGETDVVGSANEYYAGRWNDAGEFDLRTPPLNQVREPRQGSLGDEFVDEFGERVSSIDNDADFEVSTLLFPPRCEARRTPIRYQ